MRKFSFRMSMRRRFLLVLFALGSLILMSHIQLYNAQLKAESVAAWRLEHLALRPMCEHKLNNWRAHHGQAEEYYNNVTYMVDTSHSVAISLEGNLRKPLSGYRSRCWRECYQDSIQIPDTLSPNATRYIESRFIIDVTWRRELLRQQQQGIPLPVWRTRCLPYVYIIGSMKSGTTDLYTQLTRHQHIAQASTKEINYWNRLRYEQQTIFPNGFDWYLDMFHNASQFIQKTVTKDPRQPRHPAITVDASIISFHDLSLLGTTQGNRGGGMPRYLTAGTIASYQPDAKLILILRDPVDRTYSDFFRGQWFSKVPKHEIQKDFHERMTEVVGYFTDCIQKRGLQTCVREDHETSEVEAVSNSLYVAFMPGWLAAFPIEQLLVIRAEDYYMDRTPVLRHAIRFLDLEPYAEGLLTNTTRIENKGDHYDMLPETRTLLQRFFAPYNKLLEDIIGRNLWDYNNS